MKVITTLLYFFLSTAFLSAQTINWNWCKQFQRFETERDIIPHQLLKDANQNSYVIASHFDDILIDGELFPHTDNNSFSKSFISKFDKLGQQVWTTAFPIEKRLPSASIDKDNNIHVIYRQVSSPPDFRYLFLYEIFDKDFNTVSLDTIVFNNNALNGFVRPKIYVDEDLNTYLLTASGGNAQPKILGLDSLQNTSGPQTLYLLKYNKDKELLWHQNIKGDLIQDCHFSINDQNEVSVAGRFTEYLIVEEDTLIGENSNASDIFCIQFNANGNAKWKRKFGVRSSFDYLNQVQAKGEDIYLTGTLNYGQFAFDDKVVEVQHNDPYLLKLDATDGSVKDVINLPLSFAFSAGRTFTIDEEDNIILFGQYTSVDDPLGRDTLPNTPPNDPKIFMAIISQDNEFKVENGLAITGLQNLNILNAKWLEDGTISLLGTYEWEIHCGADTLVSNFLNVGGVDDVFVGNISVDLVSSTFVLDRQRGFKVFPNPNNGNFIIRKTADIFKGKKVSFAFFSLDGKLIQSGDFSGNEIEVNEHIKEKGIYLLKLVADQHVYTEKIVIH